MGMLACYLEVDEGMIERLKSQTAEDIFEQLEELEEEEGAEVYDMDKLWDGLHFILTGVSAVTPLENHPLSEAVEGTASFSEDGEDVFITYVYPERAKEISSALNAFDIDKALGKFVPHVLAENDIYPDIWDDEDADELKQEMSEAFYGLKEFYASAAGKGKGVIVSIY